MSDDEKEYCVFNALTRQFLCGFEPTSGKPIWGKRESAEIEEGLRKANIRRNKARVAAPSKEKEAIHTMEVTW